MLASAARSSSAVELYDTLRTMLSTKWMVMDPASAMHSNDCTSSATTSRFWMPFPPPPLVLSSCSAGRSKEAVARCSESVSRSKLISITLDPSSVHADSPLEYVTPTAFT